jgi:hypothetical protein
MVLEQEERQKTTTYIDINLNNNKMTATVKLSNPQFNIKSIVGALKLAGYKDIQVIETDYIPEKMRAELR